MKPTNLYRHYDGAGRLLYVGISLAALHRLSQHKKHAKWYSQIARVEIETFPTREEALAAEAVAISNENPAHNKRLPSRSPKKLPPPDFPGCGCCKWMGDWDAGPGTYMEYGGQHYCWNPRWLYKGKPEYYAAYYDEGWCPGFEPFGEGEKPRIASGPV